MKKLDTKQPIFSTPPYEALKVAQQRQVWLQAWNGMMADFNKKESTDIFALYHRHPFQPLPKNPQVPHGTQKPDCTA